MTIGAFEPGKITPEKNFLENTATLIGTDGKILNEFHKNHPVPFVEHSVPGDGKIPAIKRQYGMVSTSICFKALDLQVEMRKIYRKQKHTKRILPSW